MPEEIKDLDNLKPIDHAVVAKPHTAVYKMHRYFARRPWSVFRALIEHYSNPGSIVLDPFCGGGVTVVEGLRLRRKVIGVDLNPLATFITRLEIEPVDVDKLRSALNTVLGATHKEILELYKCRCPQCGGSATLDWLEWSNIYQCPSCHRQIAVANQRKIRWGTYGCPDECGAEICITDAEFVGEIPIQAKVRCDNCSDASVYAVTGKDAERFIPDVDRLAKFESGYSKNTPDDVMPDKLELRRPYNARFKRYADFFTPRNRIACAILLDAIKRVPEPIQRFVVGTFLSAINWAVRMCVLKKGSPAGWAAANFWTPQNPLEINVWNAFGNRANATIKGKQEGNEKVNGCHIASTLDEGKVPSSVDAVVLTQSSTLLPLADCSVDAIITDPPYGGNVMYTELGNFYAVWIRDWLDLPAKGLIDDGEEAIVSRPHGKSLADYRQLMFRAFRECHRVLKPGRWMVMTFHNREFKVWNAIHLAAHDVGFALAEQDGMIYQPPIQQFTTTIYQYRQGSMLGDFVLSFQKKEERPEFRQIEHAQIGRHIERLAAEATIHHHGASLSTIYMKLMPWLLNNNLLEKIGEKELLPYLQHNFEERDGVWHLKSDPDRALREDLERYSKEHYKASYEELDFVPIEARIEYLIRRLLYARGHATEDEILHQIYTNLINSNMAEVREIQRVLESLAQLGPLAPAGARRAKGAKKKGRKVWRLKEDIERDRLFKEMGADVQYRLATSEESDHDLAIARLVEIGALRKLKAHIGRTEQTKYTEFRRMSSDLPERIKGLPAAARAIIEQIDVLWHNGGRGVVAAFEVERTSTITSGIQRFRDLLASVPEVKISLYLVVPKSRAAEVRRKLTSPANRKEGLDRKVGYIYLEDLKIQARDPSQVDFDKIVHFVGDR